MPDLLSESSQLCWLRCPRVPLLFPEPSKLRWWEVVFRSCSSPPPGNLGHTRGRWSPGLGPRPRGQTRCRDPRPWRGRWSSSCRHLGADGEHIILAKSYHLPKTMSRSLYFPMTPREIYKMHRNCQFRPPKTVPTLPLTKKKVADCGISLTGHYSPLFSYRQTVLELWRHCVRI